MQTFKTVFFIITRSAALLAFLALASLAIPSLTSDHGTTDRVSANAPSVAPAAPTPKKVIVIRAAPTDYAGLAPRYTQAQAQSLFDNQMNTLWQNVSYGNISISATVTSLVQLPKNRAAYLGTDPSSLGNLTLIMNDAVAAASSLGLNYSGVSAVMVLLSEPVTSTLFFRGVQASRMLAIGSGGSLVSTPSAAFAENRGEGEPYVWGRWAHELGHAFQGSGPAHPSNYNNEFELMDRLYPGQSGVFEKYVASGFAGWLPPTKYTSVLITPPGNPCGGTAFIAAEELTPGSVVEAQALKVEFSAGLYYMVSVRKRLNGDELYPIPTEGVLIERVVVGADPWVTVLGKGGVRTSLWQNGDTFTTQENVLITVASTIDPNVFRITVSCQGGNQPDAFITPWLTPPLHAYETSDIWVDSLCNGFGTYQYGTYIPFGDATAVGRGNGDNPCSNHDNKVFARIRNIGMQSATNVVVYFDVTDPLGVGMAGASGWANIGNVSQADFPGLASISPGSYVDVFIHWTPSIASPPEGDFNFHSCIRVRVDGVAAELNTANNIAHENFDQFYTPPAPSGKGAPIDKVIHLINDSLSITKTFSIYWDSGLPSNWTLTINAGQTDIVLPPGGVQDLPVQIIPDGLRTTGDVFTISVAANSGRLLVNTLVLTDTHFDAPLLGGLTFEVRVGNQPTITVNAAGAPSPQGGNVVTVTGQFSPTNPFGQGWPIMIDLRAAQRSILTSRLVTTDGAGNFTTVFLPGQFSGQAFYATAFFTGDDTLAGVSLTTVITPTKTYLPLIMR